MAPVKERILPRRIPKKSTFQDCYAYEVPGLLAFRVKPEAANIVAVGSKKQVRLSSYKDEKLSSLLSVKPTIIKEKKSPCVCKSSKSKKKVSEASGAHALVEIKKEPDNVDYDKPSIKSIDLPKENKQGSELQKSIQISQEKTVDGECEKVVEGKSKEVINFRKEKGNVGRSVSSDKKHTLSNEKKVTLGSDGISDKKVVCKSEKVETCELNHLVTQGIDTNGTKSKSENEQKKDYHSSNYLLLSSELNPVKIYGAISNAGILPRPLTDLVYWQPKVVVDRLISSSVTCKEKDENLNAVDITNENESIIATLKLMKVDKEEEEEDVEMNTVAPVINNKDTGKKKQKVPRTVSEKNIQICIGKKGKKKQKTLFQSMSVNSAALKKNTRIKSKRPVKVLGETSQKLTTRNAKKNKPKTSTLKLLTKRNNTSKQKSVATGKRPVKRSKKISQISQQKDLCLPETNICRESFKVEPLENSDVLDELYEMDPEGDTLIAESNSHCRESASGNTGNDCDNMSWSSLQLLHLLKDLEKMRSATDKQCRELGKLKRVVHTKNSEIRVLKYKLHCYESDKLHHILKNVITEARCAPCGERETNQACSIVDKLMAYARVKDLC